MNSTTADLEALFNCLVDGLASEEDERRLSELLRGDPEARRAYREFMSLHSALHWDYVAAAVSEPSCEPLAVRPRAPGRLRVTAHMRRTTIAAFVAGLIVASITALAVLRPFASTDKPSTVGEARDTTTGNRRASQADSIAALLVDEVGAEFAPGRSPDGVRFGPGEYELLAGIVHLRFTQGADVVLAGPARLDVKGAQRVRLGYGKVRVTAPPTAKGFTIETRNANYIDLGTEFGLRVDPRGGASDLYVFDGQVNVADPQSGKVLSEVAEGQTSRYVDGSVGVAPELNEKDFPTSGAIGYQRWRRHAEDLTQDPGLAAFFPFQKTPDESVLANRVGVDAMGDGRIEGARWMTGRWPGKDALLFDRDTDFVELEIAGEFQEMTIAVWLKVDRLDFGLNAILNSDGYDLGDIHFQLTRQGYPRGGVAVDGRFEDKVVGNSAPLGRWTHVASVLPTRTRSQQIFVNGVLTRERRYYIVDL